MKSFSRLILLVAASVSVFLLVVSYFFFTGFGDHMLRNHTAAQADTVARLTFSSMYQLMNKGWNRQQVLEFTDNAAGSVANSPTRIRFYRGESVARQYGEIPGQTMDDDIALAMRSGRVRQVDSPDGVTYAFPLLAQDLCLRCHTQARSGEVLGVIAVESRFGVFMNETRKHMMLVFLLFSPTPFIAGLMVAVHLNARFENLAAGIDDVRKQVEAGQPPDFSPVRTRYAEFSDLLDRVKKLAAALRP